ncbi:hypothetical protein [Pectobacterium punjabense]|uniref:hypothetical protein n=1 Tax=Pectobacterium punjabense TaxID=2108399 RepID=UPI002B23F44C|nr:hypothetical protein [Pectobacterium punjabense]
MISISKEEAFVKSYPTKHQDYVRSFITGKNLTISFFGHNLNLSDNTNNALIDTIAIDPFSFSHLTPNQRDFLRDYQEISHFLLYGKTYFDFVTSEAESLSVVKKKKFHLEARQAIIIKFGHNSILQKMGIFNETHTESKKKYLAFHKKVKDEFEIQNTSIKCAFNYNNFLKSKDNLRAEILSNINITVCPYCNRQYVDFYAHEGKVKSVAQIDHLLPESVFPLYALSLMNFTPSCYHCNCSIKKDRLFPWKKIYCNDPVNKKHFKLIYTELSGLYGNKEQFTITVNPKSEEDRLNAYFFRHELIYSNHKEDVSLLLKRRLILAKGYKTSVKKILGEEITDDEFRNIILGVTTNEKELLTKPLTKLKKDILNY